MATGTVADERRERKRELERTKEELAAAMTEYAAAELAAAATGGEPESHPALVDRRVRRTALLAARRGLEAAYVRDRSDGGAGKVRSCPECGGRMRHAGREVSPVETAVERVRVSMARYACDGCGTSVRPRGRAMDIEGSMTPTARRMASLAGSSCCYAEANRLLVELAEVNYGANVNADRKFPKSAEVKFPSSAGRFMVGHRCSVACSGVVGRAVWVPVAARWARWRGRVRG